MRGTTHVKVGIFLIPMLLGGQPVSAQTVDAETLRQEIAQLRKDFETRLSELEARLTAAIGGQTAPVAQPPGGLTTVEVPPGAAGAGGPSGALPVYGPVSVASKIFNPDIAVVGDFLGAAGRNTVNPSPALEMHETELSLQAIVDPYARADFFVAFGAEGAEVEEGFITLPTLPWGLLMKAGKLRAAFGKVNTMHNHILPWTDRPLVTNNLVGGGEGMSDAGISVARLISNPWIFLEATGEVYRGTSEIFSSATRGDLSYVGHLRGYHDLTDNANVDLGASYARGGSAFAGGLGEPRFHTDMWGVDAAVRWRPLQRAIYRSFLGRSELVWRRDEQSAGRERTFGFYASGDYQLARRWFAGARYDRADRVGDAGQRDSGQSVTLTYWPSEYSQVRGQYRRVKYAEGPVANELLFQLLFSIGAHGAHTF